MEMLEQVNKSVIEITNYLSDVVEPFDGTVNVTSEKPPVLANYTSLRAWADEILENVTFYNTTAYQYYKNITTHFEEVRYYRYISWFTLCVLLCTKLYVKPPNYS